MLDAAIEEYTVGHPRRGEKMITGMARATQATRISRSEIRSSIIRVDQGGLAIRRESFGRRIIWYLFFVDKLDILLPHGLILLIVHNTISYILRYVRRVYNVARPHHLWHHDEHHKLIRYGLITHGCVDVFSRAILCMSFQYI